MPIPPRSTIYACFAAKLHIIHDLCGQNHPLPPKTIHLRQWKQKKSRKTVRRQAADINADVTQKIAEELFDLEHKQNKLKLYVALLDDRQAEIIQMTCFKKIPAVQVAKHFDVTERTIERTKKAAIEKLAEMYEYADRFKGWFLHNPTPFFRSDGIMSAIS